MKLRIEKAVYGGAGLGRAGAEDAALAGKTIFVPLTLPGELVECEITEDRRSFANARLTHVLEAAASRVAAPRCEYFPVCGGCHYQHADYAAQLEMKRAILVETLAHAGIDIAADAIAVIAGEPLAYRNRIRLQIRFGDFALCYRETGSHRNVAVDHCPIAAPLLQQAMRVFPEIAIGTGLAAGLFDEVEFFTNDQEGTLLLTLWTERGNAASRAVLPVICEALHEAVPQLAGGLLFEADSAKGQGRQQAAWGDATLKYNVGEHAYRVSAGSFFQVNRFLVSKLVDTVVSDQSGTNVWDLYAGAGLFSAALARGFEHVTAVESSASSVRDLRANLKGKGHRVVASSTLEFLQTQVRGAIKPEQMPDLVVVDPPRAGLGKDVTTLLSQIGPPKLTYISCDPATLARDVQWLLQFGYQLRNITLIDLFPQTFHLETVAELVRA